MRICGSGKKVIWGIVIAFTLLIPLSITACARTRGEFVKLSTDIYPPKSEAQEILITQSDIDKSYKEIGLVKAKGNQYTEEEECFEKIRQIAKEVGADAVIKARGGKRERLVSWRTPGKVSRIVRHKVKEPVCEGTAVVFTNNG